MIARALLAALSCALLLAPAHAAFEDLGVGGRAPGMGGAFSAIADDVYAAHYNPAGLSLLDRPQLGTSYSVLFPGLGDGSSLGSSYIAYAHPFAEGRRGTAAVSWNSFSLSGQYRDDSFGLSYGRRLYGGSELGELHGGVTLKYLRSSFGSFGEAQSAVATRGVVGTGQRDPVLSGARTMGAVDSDAGLLFRFTKHYAVGLALSHINQPNVAFDRRDSDKLPLGAKLGMSYRSLISNITAEYATTKAPSGARDQSLSLGLERWFPKLYVGDFGVRGGGSVGTRDQRHLSLGASYRTRRFGVDYAFLLPIGGLGTAGNSHRVGLSFRFGRPTDEEESVEMLLEAMRQLKSGQATGPLLSKQVPTASSRAVDEHLAQARGHESRAEYQKALAAFSKALSAAPASKELLERFSRLSFIAQAIPSLPAYQTDPAQAQLHAGIVSYLAGDFFESMRAVSAARALKPDHRGLQLFLEQLELLTGVKAKSLPKDRPSDYVLSAKLTRANAAIEDGRYAEAVELSLEVIRVDPNMAAAWQNLGTAYFALKDYDSSLRSWRKAYELEKSPSIRQAIRGYMRSIERRASRKAEAPPKVVEHTPLPERPTMTSKEKEALFEKAIEHYMSRDLQKAKAALETLLEADPQHAEAQKALRRIKDEMP